MSKAEKVRGNILSGQSDKNIKFDDIRYILNKMGFQERIRGDHHIFTKEGVEEIINLQPVGNLAKAYQVKQVRGLILKYKLEA